MTQTKRIFPFDIVEDYDGMVCPVCKSTKQSFIAVCDECSDEFNKIAYQPDAWPKGVDVKEGQLSVIMIMIEKRRIGMLRYVDSV
jgi:ribosomal protein L37AE/L43A